MSVPGINIAALAVTMNSSLNNRNPMGRRSEPVLAPSEVTTVSDTDEVTTVSDTDAELKWLLIGVGVVFGILIFSGLIAITVLLFK